jgi:hypothetical protein
VRRVDPPVLSPEERARYDEVQRYLARRYRDYRIVETTQTYIGDIIDWLDPATFLHHQQPGQPSGQNRLYAGLVAPNPNKRVVSWVNDFGDIIEPSTMSLIETATVCPGSSSATTMELVGAATSRDWWNLGSGLFASGGFGQAAYVMTPS